MYQILLCDLHESCIRYSELTIGVLSTIVPVEQLQCEYSYFVRIIREKSFQLEYIPDIYKPCSYFTCLPIMSLMYRWKHPLSATKHAFLLFSIHILRHVTYRHTISCEDIRAPFISMIAYDFIIFVLMKK